MVEYKTNSIKGGTILGSMRNGIESAGKFTKTSAESIYSKGSRMLKGVSLGVNYAILDPSIEDFFDENFYKKLKGIIKNYEDKINTKNIVDKEKEIHKKRMVNDYLIPIAYLIYSFIYTKYYNNQLRRTIVIENNLNYEMYKFFFKHSNPIIKSVNIFFYKEFTTEKNNTSSNIIIFDKIKAEKDSIKNFLEKTIIPYIISENNYGKNYELYENIIEYLEKAKGDIEKIKESGVSLNNSYKIEKVFFDKKNNAVQSNYEKFSSGLAYTYYSSMLNNINEANLNIIKLDDYKNNATNISETTITKINISIINIENISFNLIKTLIDSFNSKKETIEGKLEKEKVKIDLINRIIDKFDEKIELYDDFFKLTNNNKNENKKKSYDTQIKKINNKIKSYIIQIIDETNPINNKNNLSNNNIAKLKSNMNKIELNNETNTDYKFDSLLKSFLISLYKQENVEEKYLNIFRKTPINIKPFAATTAKTTGVETAVVAEESVESSIKTITTQKFNFDNKFRSFKKEKIDKTSDTIKELKKTKKTVENESDEIDKLLASKEYDTTQLESDISSFDEYKLGRQKRKDLYDLKKKKEKTEETIESIKSIENILNNNLNLLKIFIYMKKIIAELDIKKIEITNQNKIDKFVSEYDLKYYTKLEETVNYIENINKINPKCDDNILVDYLNEELKFTARGIPKDEAYYKSVPGTPHPPPAIPPAPTIGDELLHKHYFQEIKKICVLNSNEINEMKTGKKFKDAYINFINKIKTTSNPLEYIKKINNKIRSNILIGDFDKYDKIEQSYLTAKKGNTNMITKIENNIINMRLQFIEKYYEDIKTTEERDYKRLKDEIDTKTKEIDKIQSLIDFKTNKKKNLDILKTNSQTLIVAIDEQITYLQNPSAKRTLDANTIKRYIQTYIDSITNNSKTNSKDNLDYIKSELLKLVKKNDISTIINTISKTYTKKNSSTNLDAIKKEILTKIDNEQKILNQNKNINSKKQLKKDFDDSFNKLLDISTQYSEIINLHNEKKTNNKMYYFYNKNTKLTMFIDEITTKIIKSNKLLTTDITIKDITDEIIKYFYNDDDLFFQEIEKQINNIDEKNSKIKPFFDEYQNFYNDNLIEKIIILLKKINNENITLIKSKDPKKIDEFRKSIIKSKIDKRAKIIAKANVLSENQKGSYTVILPYTDIMFLYFIDLLIVIDFLTFFYE